MKDFFVLQDDAQEQQLDHKVNEHYVDVVRPSDSKKLINSLNIAEDLEGKELRDIAQQVIQGLNEDRDSMSEWLRNAQTCMELVEGKLEEKNIPFRGAANIKYPMLTVATVQFAARAFPEMFKQGVVADYRVLGNDPTGAKDRLGKRRKMFMNYQILEKMPHWREHTDKLLHTLPVVGTCFIKTWFDPMEMVCRSELVPYTDIFVNTAITSLKEATRISQYLYVPSNQIKENIRSGIYSDMDVDNALMDKHDSKAVHHALIESHCWWDLDCDGLAEPYIVTVHESTERVLRIVARYSEKDISYNAKKQIRKINPEHYYSDIHFIPCPYSFFSWSYGSLLLAINRTSNTILNQLINAGHLATTQGGFLGKGLRIKKEDMSIQPGEWKVAASTDGSAIKDNIVPMIYKEPSQTLFNLLGMLLTAAKEVTSISDALLGQADLQNTSPNSLQSQIAQGLKVYSSIIRRIQLGKGGELEKLARLNTTYANPQEYVQLISPSQQELQEMFDPETGKLLDFENTGVKIVTVIDSNESTTTERMGKAQGLMSSLPQLTQLGAVNPRVGAKYIYEAMEIEPEVIAQLVLPEPQPQPNPDLIKIQAKSQADAVSAQLSAQKLNIDAQVAKSKIDLHKAQAHKALADADTNHGAVQLEVVKTALNDGYVKTDQKLAAHKVSADMLGKTMQHSATMVGHSVKTENKNSTRSKALPLPEVVRTEALKRGWRIPSVPK